MSKIDISVIVPSYNSEQTIIDCLRSVSTQEFDGTHEIIVADSSVDRTAALVCENFPEVKLITFSEKTDPGTARNIAAAASQGIVIAFIDSDCSAESGWLSSIYAEHKHTIAAVGGAVVNGNPDGIVSWAGYLLEFSEWFPAKKRTLVEHIPTCNISYKAEVFKKQGGFSKFYPQEDFLFNLKLVRAGNEILFEPTIRVRHKHRECFSEFLEHQKKRGVRGFEIRNMAAGIKDPYGAFPILCPFFVMVRLLRIVIRFLKKPPTNLLRLILIVPVIIFGLIWWTAGFWSVAFNAAKPKSN